MPKQRTKANEPAPFDPALFGMIGNILGGVTGMVGGIVGGEDGAHIANAGNMVSGISTGVANEDIGAAISAGI